MAAVAAALLQHVHRPDPAVEEGAQPSPPQQVSGLRTQLTAALERAAAAETAARSADRQRIAATEEIHHLKTLMAAAGVDPREHQHSTHDLKLRASDRSLG